MTRDRATTIPHSSLRVIPYSYLNCGGLPFIIIDAGNDLGKMIHEEFAPFGPRLVIPIEERYVGDLPTEGSEEA